MILCAIVLLNYFDIYILGIVPSAVSITGEILYSKFQTNSVVVKIAHISTQTRNCLSRVRRRAVARVLLVGGKRGQYKFINRNFSAESRKIVLLIFKPFKVSKTTIYISIILENS